MANTVFPGCPVIEVHYGLAQDEPKNFEPTVTRMLHRIGGKHVGRKMYGDFVRAGKLVRIRYIGRAYNVNCCLCPGSGRFFLLRQAFNAPDRPSIARELQWSLEQSKMTIFKLARIASGGIPPVTAQTENNVAPQLPAPANAQQYVEVYDQLYCLLNNMQVQYPETHDGHYGLADKLVRILKPWLRAGPGAGSTIYYNPNAELSCGNDGRPARRPPLIGLAHELCHAWRNATGQRLFDDYNSCRLYDDEVMTTGIPPYQYETVTENMFRIVLTPEVSLRTRYR